MEIASRAHVKLYYIEHEFLFRYFCVVSFRWSRARLLSRHSISFSSSSPSLRIMCAFSSALTLIFDEPTLHKQALHPFHSIPSTNQTSNPFAFGHYGRPTNESRRSNRAKVYCARSFTSPTTQRTQSNIVSHTVFFFFLTVRRSHLALCAFARIRLPHLIRSY